MMLPDARLLMDRTPHGELRRRRAPVSRSSLAAGPFGGRRGGLEALSGRVGPDNNLDPDRR